ncbi:SatD family protein [Oryzobacter terrae]|uniref:SatD family protein n=1 Tax=Oryzobacter terrae TaxID=1620385 RepID=UPI00366C4953
MGRMKDQASRVVLIGDIVDSRGATNRRALHRAVEKALVGVNAVVPALGELRVTVGDEFQGSYATLGGALDAALRVRLHLLPGVDTRFGIGRGAVTTLDARRGLEDGPGWWAARSAIEAAEAAATTAATRTARTAVRAADDDPVLDAVNAALLCRDHLVGSLSDRSLRLLRGLMDPHTTQSELATLEGISASAVSQRVRADGIGAVLAAHELLRALP